MGDRNDILLVYIHILYNDAICAIDHDRAMKIHTLLIVMLSILNDVEMRKIIKAAIGRRMVRPNSQFYKYLQPSSDIPSYSLYLGST